MTSYAGIPAVPAGSSLATPLKELGTVYERIHEEQALWQAATPWRCPEGCAACCSDFEPDILDIEALWLAAWILEEQGQTAAIEGSGKPRTEGQGSFPAPTEAERFIEQNSQRKGCVLAREEGPWFCSVYGGRPLVCRLFAFSGDRDKDHRARFRPCAKLADREKTNHDTKSVLENQKKSLSEAELLERYGRLPPIMGDLAALADSILPGSNERERLREALPKALAKMRMLMQYSSIIPFPTRSLDSDDGNDNPDGSTPPMDSAV